MKSYLDFLYELPKTQWVLKFTIPEFPAQIALEEHSFEQALKVCQDFLRLYGNTNVVYPLGTSCTSFDLGYCELFYYSNGRVKAGRYERNCFFPFRKKDKLTFKFDN